MDSDEKKTYIRDNIPKQAFRKPEVAASLTHKTNITIIKRYDIT